METYHILYRANSETPYVTGINIKAHNMLEALQLFLNEYKTEPIVIYNLKINH